MQSGRWKKVAIAGAILIIGTVTAWQFRHEAPAESAAPKMVPLPGKTETAAKPQSPEAAKLAGRIEPYTATEDKADTPRGLSYADPIAQQRHQAEAGTAASDHGPGVESGRLAANSAPGSSSETLSDRVLQPQTVRRPFDFGSQSPAAHAQPAFERLAGELTAAGRAPDKRHKIVDGDTLPALAHRYLDSAGRSSDLFEYNRDVLATPDVLPIGKELRIPPADFSSPTASLGESHLRALANLARPDVAQQSQPNASAPAVLQPPVAAPVSAARTYVVQPHDTLPLIARKLYGDISRQSDLMAANRQQLRTPRDLRPGMTLFVPANR